MNLDEERFNVYIDAIKRTRWFLLITTLLSCLLLIHMYLEQFSYQEEQLIDTLKTRAKEDSPARLEHLKERIKADIAKETCDPTKLSKDKLEEVADEYAGLQYRMKVTDNTLNNVTIPNRALPLLPVTIPGNDFLPIIGTMLLIFVIAVWLNIRSVLAAIHSLKPGDNEETREMIRLHFTFTGLVGYPGVEQKIVHVVQYAAFLLPCLSFLIAVVIDVVSIVRASYDPKVGYSGPIGLFILQTVIMAIEIILLSIITAVTISKVKEIGEITDSDTTLTS